MDYNDKLPEFTANEMNILGRKARDGSNLKSQEYYKKCLDIVEKHENGEIKYYTEKMARWLYGIHADLKEE
jgi:hypothetical protein